MQAEQNPQGACADATSTIMDGAQSLPVVAEVAKKPDDGQNTGVLSKLQIKRRRRKAVIAARAAKNTELHNTEQLNADFAEHNPKKKDNPDKNFSGVTAQNGFTSKGTDMDKLD